ncbi:hypothetical protein VTN96DRAFT_2289 [Rasamsonia emersonii]
MQYKDDKEFKEEFYRQIAGKGVEGALCIRTGSNIVRVLKKEVDPLYLMFGMDDLLDRIYSEMVGTGDLHNLTRAYIDLIGHSRTDLNILEIGAGTGSLTTAFLETLSPLPSHEQSSGKSSRISKYIYTDISAWFFEKAKERYKSWRNILDFQTLNIEIDPQEQGFAKGEYDIVVAGNVLHATADLRKTLKHVRSLLKPGGRLILYEGIRQDFLPTPLAFGQLAGWWLGVEPIRKWSAWINEEEWGRVLRDTGFSGVDMSLKDRQDPDLHGFSILVASAVGNEAYQSRISTETLIVIRVRLKMTLHPHLRTNGLKNMVFRIVRLPSIQT